MKRQAIKLLSTIVVTGMVFGLTVVPVWWMMGVVPGDQLFREGLKGSLVAVEMEQRGCLGNISLASPGAHRGVENIQ